MSDENGMFSEPYPNINLPFKTSHNLEELKLTFGVYENEYIEIARITFFDDSGNIVLRQNYKFDSNPAIITDKVIYRRILIEAVKTSAPFRFATIQSIDYGKSFFIPLTEQYRSGKDSATEYFSGVEVISHEFVRGDEVIEAHKSEYNAGVHTIPFHEPLHSLIPDGCTIISSNANHAVVNVPVQREIIISGKRFVHNQRSHIVREEIMAGETDNIKRYENFMLVSPDRGLKLATLIFEHLKKRVIVEQDILLKDREVGYIGQIETWGLPVVGVISRLENNLRAGTARIEIIGDVVI